MMHPFAQFMQANSTPRDSAPSNVPADSPVIDHAKRILTAAPDMTDDQRAPAWEHFHSARDSKDLTARLTTVDVPPEVKAALVKAKAINDPVPTHVDQVVEAIHRLAALDPQLLEISEAHPHVLKHLTDAASQGE
jgi:hypothetical protein